MRGKPLFQNVNLINSLPILTLDISGTGVQHLWAVKDIEIVELIMKDVKFKDLEPLEYMGNLRKLVVSKGHFTQEELKAIPGHVKVIEE